MTISFPAVVTVSARSTTIDLATRGPGIGLPG
jgi:hypothetical protein